ncbi:hypothetical protein ACH41H_27125 [Streptomyces sp. NPDC020800]
MLADGSDIRADRTGFSPHRCLPVERFRARQGSRTPRAAAVRAQADAAP